jgi:hypothetical protein
MAAGHVANVFTASGRPSAGNQVVAKTYPVDLATLPEVPVAD